MPPTIQDLGIDTLAVGDKLALAEAIWESVAADIERSPLTDAQRRELERRLADSIARPDALVPWETVKAQRAAGLHPGAIQPAPGFDDPLSDDFWAGPS